MTASEALGRMTPADLLRATLHHHTHDPNPALAYSFEIAREVNGMPVGLHWPVALAASDLLYWAALDYLAEPEKPARRRSTHPLYAVREVGGTDGERQVIERAIHLADVVVSVIGDGL